MKYSQNLFVQAVSLSLLVVSSSPAGTIWDGGGSGPTINDIDNSKNWDGGGNGVVNALNGTTPAVFATGGSTALINVNASFTGITLNSSTAFSITDGGATNLTIGSGGIAMSLPSTTSLTHTISESNLILAASQTWAVTNNGAGLAQLNVSSVISGSGFGINKTGSGTLQFSGANTYTGATTIKAGTLKLNVAGSLASTSIIVGDAGSSGAILDATTRTGGFTVASGQTVSGVGTIQGSTTVQSGGNLTPGDGGAGVLNNLGNIALQSGSSFNLDMTSAALGSGYDQLNVTGAVTLGGLLAVNMGAFVPSNGSLFFVLANDSTDAISGVFSNAPTNGGTYTLGGQQFQISYFGNHTGAGAGTFTGGNDVVLMAVPEPSASLLGGIGVLLLLRRRRSA